MATKPRTSSPRLKTARDATPLPSARLPTPDLIDVGTRFSADALTTHGQAVLSRISAPGFAAYGFDSAWADRMNTVIAGIETKTAEVAAGRANALPSGEHLDAAIGRAKEWRRVANTAVAIIPGRIAKGLRLASGTSVSALVSTISKLVPAVKKAPVTPYGTGAETAAEGVSILAELKAAQKAHKLALAKLPPNERALHQLKGALYEELKRVARVARNVVPAESTDFAATTFLRMQRHRRPKAKAGDAATTPARTATTPA